MAYAVMRCKKLKTMGCVASALQHCYRERETPNADPSCTPENTHYGARSTHQAMGKLRERLPEKRRKDAVLAVEYVMTASPEWFHGGSTPERQREFFERSLEWLRDKYGPENVLAATVHRDEKTPHLSAFVVPVTRDGRLSAKEFIGNRKLMSADQTAFSERVRHLGLERGIEGSRATHKRVKTHYTAIQQGDIRPPRITPSELEPKVLEKKLLSKTIEGPEMIAERLNAKVREDYGRLREHVATAELDRSRAVEMAKTARAAQIRENRAMEALEKTRDDLGHLQGQVNRIFKGLSKEEVGKLVDTADRMRAEKEAERAKNRHSRGYDRGPSLGF